MTDLAGELEEHVVERRLADAEVFDGDPGVAQVGRHGDEGVDPAGRRGGDRAGLGVDDRLGAGRFADDRHRLVEVVGSGDDGMDVVATDLPLERAGVAAGDDAAAVDDDDVVGEALGFVEVLRGQQQRGAAVDERVEDLPQLGARPRVESRRRLVEEQHLRPGDERGGEVEPAAHPARVPRHHTVGGLGERELLEQLDSAGAGVLAAQLMQLAEHHEVLPPGEQGVDGGVLGGEADAPAHLAALGGDVETGDRGRPGRGIGERRENAHRRRLAGAVRPEHGGDGAGVDLDVDAGEGGVVAVELDEVAGDDGVADVEIGRRRGAALSGSFVDEIGHGSPPDGSVASQTNLLAGVPRRMGNGCVIRHEWRMTPCDQGTSVPAVMLIAVAVIVRA